MANRTQDACKHNPYVLGSDEQLRVLLLIPHATVHPLTL